jgi:hypothetical protein
LGGCGDGSDDPSDTSKQEADAAPVGVMPKESIPKSYPQLSSEQGQAEDSCNQCHDYTFLVKDPSTRLPLCVGATVETEQTTLQYKVSILAATTPAVKDQVVVFSLDALSNESSIRKDIG